MASTPSPTAPSSMPSASSGFAVGNDVVDLAEPRCRAMPLDGRFVRRVCAREERDRIVGADDPRHTLWRVWAAKEAAYKVISKHRGAPPPFVHARFLVRRGTDDGGSVVFEDTRIPFREEPRRDPGALHVVAWLPGGSPVLDGSVEELPEKPPPLHRLSERERKAVHSPASGWVRLRARARAASLLGLPETELEIVCDEGLPGRAIPRLLVGGRVTGWDVSLSHHGRWIAWALGRAGSGPDGPARRPEGSRA